MAHEGAVWKTPLTASHFPDKLSALLILPSLPCRLTHHPLWRSDGLWHLNVLLGNAVPSFQCISSLKLEANPTQQKKLSKRVSVRWSVERTRAVAAIEVEQFSCKHHLKAKTFLMEEISQEPFVLPRPTQVRLSALFTAPFGSYNEEST